MSHSVVRLLSSSEESGKVKRVNAGIFCEKHSEECFDPIESFESCRKKLWSTVQLMQKVF